MVLLKDTLTTSISCKAEDHILGGAGGVNEREGVKVEKASKVESAKYLSVFKARPKQAAGDATQSVKQSTHYIAKT